MSPLTFRVTVKRVQVTEKLEKHEDYTETVKRGTLTLEFDGDSVNTGDIVEMIKGEQVLLGLADSQLRLGEKFADQSGIEKVTVKIGGGDEFADKVAELLDEQGIEYERDVAIPGTKS